MTGRPITLVLATGLLFLIGASGALVGGELLVAGAGVGTGALIAGGIAAYGVGCAVAGLGLLLLRLWAWWLALGSVLLGLAVLVWIQILVIGAAPDAVSAVGLVVWGLALALLLAPATRDATRRA